MAAVIAAVISAAAAGGSAYFGSQAQKKAAKQSSKGSTMPVFTPQGQAAQDQVLRLLFERMGKAPQSFKDYKQTGPQAAMDLSSVPFHQRELLGLGSGLPMVNSPNIPPQLIAAMQRLGIVPTGPMITAGDLQPGVVRPPSTAPMSAPRK